MLEVKDVHAHISDFHVLHGVSLNVQPGELVCLIGANGAGKSTLLRVIAGLMKPSQGSIRLNGKEISGLRPESIVKRSVALCPENRHLFPLLSVRKNLQLGAYKGPYSRKIKTECFDFVYELFPILRERGSQLAGTLSGGEQQMLAIGRALMSRPHLLLLDEPSLGLAPKIIESIQETIIQINKKGTTILLSEQNANIALSMSSRGYVMENGRFVLEGGSSQLAADPSVKKAYLGL